MCKTSWEAELIRLQENPLSELEILEMISELSKKLEFALQSINIQEAITKLHLDSHFVEDLEKILESYTTVLSEVDYRASLLATAALSWSNNPMGTHIAEVRLLIDKSRKARTSKETLVELASMRKEIQIRSRRIESFKTLAESLDTKIGNALNCNNSVDVTQLEIELAKAEWELERLRDYALSFGNRYARYKASPYGDELGCNERELQLEEFKRLGQEASTLLGLLKNSEYRRKLDPVYCELKVKETLTKGGLCELVKLYAGLANDSSTSFQATSKEYDRERAKYMVALCKEALDKLNDCNS